MVLLQVEDISLIPRDITLKLTTSAIDNVVDYAVANGGSDIGAAFAIYAKVYNLFENMSKLKKHLHIFLFLIE